MNYIAERRQEEKERRRAEILAEALAHEEEGLEEYRKLLVQVAGKSIMLEEYARDQISAEEEHLAEIRKMMRKPGSIK